MASTREITSPRQGTGARSGGAAPTGRTPARRRNEAGGGRADGFGAKIAVTLTTLSLLFVVFEYIVPASGIESYILPQPSSVVESMVRDLTNASFWGDIRTTLTEVGLGWLIGCTLGLALAVLVTEFKLFDIAFSPYIVALNSVPKVALAPVIVVAFGYGATSKVVIAAIMAFFPVLINVRMGLSRSDALQLELMRSLRASRIQALRFVKFPSALPSLFAGLELAAVLAIIGAIVGEFTGASSGLGYIIMQRTFALDQAGVFSSLVVLSLIGITLTLAVRQLGQRLITWQ